MLKNNRRLSKSVSISMIVVVLMLIYGMEIADVERTADPRDSDSPGGSSVFDDDLSFGNPKFFMVSPSKPSLPKALRSYYPNAAIKPQLPALRDAAGKGDSHAACVLSRALLLCANAAEDLSLLRYSSDYLASLNEKNVESFASSIASHESAVSDICRGVDQNDLEDIGDWMYQSA